MVKLGVRVSGGSFFPRVSKETVSSTDESGHRSGENRVHVKCVLCSMTMRGYGRNTGPFWGDVTVRAGEGRAGRRLGRPNHTYAGCPCLDANLVCVWRPGGRR